MVVRITVIKTITVSNNIIKCDSDDNNNNNYNKCDTLNN